MMLRHPLPLTLLAVAHLALPVAAQAQDPAMESVRPHYERVKGYLLRAAEQMSEEDLAFRPTEEVRSAAALLGHIADAQHYFCSVALGEATPHQTEIEKTETTRAGLIAALRESFDYCDRAYAQSDADALQPVRAGTRGQPRLSQLVLNATHNSEHYGNIVTYMRMRGLVPPSSQPRP